MKRCRGSIFALLTALCMATMSLGAHFLPAVANASDQVVPPDPWEIIHTARTFGPAEVKRDPLGDPMIVGNVPARDGEAPGLNYELIFHGCDLGKNCQSVLFIARLIQDGWAKEPPDLDVFASWNTEKLFGRARLDAQNQAVLEHPVAMRAGLPADSLSQTFEMWQMALREYAEHVEFAPE